MNMLYLLSLWGTFTWFVRAAEWPTIPQVVQLLSWNKASFSKLISDIRFWQTFLTDHLSNLSKKWVICHEADCSGKMLWCVQKNKTGLGKWTHIESAKSTMIYMIHQQATVKLKFTFCRVFSKKKIKSRTVHNYKTTEWYLMLAGGCWALAWAYSGNTGEGSAHWDRGAVVESEQLGLCIYKTVRGLKQMLLFSLF